jgi:peptidoglycan/LPS O-acetylase OafA/YrhL
VWGGGERSLARVPALDGLRGLAVAGVLLFHGAFGWAGGGFLGVSIFFTLSGFLITSLLLTEHESTGRIGLGHFWGRRARRILPAALLALAGIAVYGLTVADASQVTRLPADGLSALFEVANWRFVFGDQSYAALFSSPSPVQHFWSLAIEEQFYLVFPLIVLATLSVTHGEREGLAIVIVVLGTVSVVLAGVLYTPGEDPSRVYYGTDTRAVELLMGALLAVALTGRHRLESRGSQLVIAALGAVALLALILGWLVVEQSDEFLYRGGLTLHALLVSTVIAAALVPGPVRAALAITPLRALGFISYGAYLYHWPIFLWLSPERTGLDGWALFGVRLAVTIGVAALSWYYIEQPILNGRRITGWRPALVAPAAAVAVAALFITLPGPSRGSDIVFSAVRKPAAALADLPEPAGATPAPTTPTLPVTGPDAAAAAPAPVAATVVVPPPPPPPPVRRILMLGVSVAQTVGRGLERWGPGNGVVVVNAARYYCGIARGGRLGALLGREANTCGDWNRVWPSLLDRVRPDVVVMLSTIWDIGARQRDAWGPDFLRGGDPRFDQYVADEWRQAAQLLGSRGARVVWLTNPCSAQDGLSRDLRYANTKYLPELQKTHPVIKLDLFARVCPNGQFTNRLGAVADARPDGVHFSDSGADWVAGWLGPRLVDPHLTSDRAPVVRVRRA